MPAINLQDYERLARLKLQPEHYDYFAGGAQGEVTLRANRSAFDRLQILPRIMRGAPAGISTLEINLLGARQAMPVLIAPTAFHCLAHPRGECASAGAARETGIPMIISMASTRPVEEIITAASHHPTSNPGFWFQLYIQPDRVFTETLVRRVETAGCSALVVTADSPTFGLRERDLRHDFLDLPAQYHCAHLNSAGTRRNIEFDPTLTWKDIDWLQSITGLPIVVKGVAHPEDAQLALEHGVDALMVSNHGGRQLDTVAASIELLPAVAAAIDGRIPILLDGGIRRGTDIIKALALGATAVAIGRPILWGLAVAGQAGVRDVLELLQRELLNALTLSGGESIDNLDTGILFKPGVRLS